MIAKITNGSDPGGLAAYLHGPGVANEHAYAQVAGGAVIGGNLGLEGERDGATWAVLLRQAVATRPEIAKAVWHASLRNPAGDRVLSDREWAIAAQDFAQGMGFGDHPWVAVRHGVDHVHLVASRVGFDGRVWSRRDDRYKAQRACTGIEASLGLSAAPRRATEVTQRAADHQVSAGEWRRGVRAGAAPERVVLAGRVRAAAAAATGRGREGFEAALGRAGVAYRANEASTGTMSGYSFALPGHRDPAGEAVWFRASQLDKALAWSRLAPVLDGPVPAPTVAVVSKGPLESHARYERRMDKAQVASRLAGVALAAQRGTRAAEQWWQARQEQAGAGAAARALTRQQATAPAASVVEPDAAAAIAARSFPTDLSQALTARARARAQQATPQAARQVTEQGARAPYRPRQDPGRTKGPSQGR